MPSRRPVPVRLFAHLQPQASGQDRTTNSRNWWRFCCLASWFIVALLVVFSDYGSRHMEVGKGGTAASYKRGITGSRSAYEELRVIDGEWHGRKLAPGSRWEKISVGKGEAADRESGK